MAWREKGIAVILALVIYRGVFYILTLIGNAFNDAKKWRERQYRENKFGKSKRDLYKEIEELEKEKEGLNAIMDDYIGYTGIQPREISEKLEKKNKRKKRR